MTKNINDSPAFGNTTTETHLITMQPSTNSSLISAIPLPSQVPIADNRSSAILALQWKHQHLCRPECECLNQGLCLSIQVPQQIEMKAHRKLESTTQIPQWSNMHRVNAHPEPRNACSEMDLQFRSFIKYKKYGNILFTVIL